MTGTQVSTASGFVPICNFGDFSGPCENCIMDAQDGFCAGLLNACIENPACLDFNDCVFQCGGNPDCCASCAGQDPGAAALFTDLVFCLTCQSCPFECSSFVPGFCD